MCNTCARSKKRIVILTTIVCYSGDEHVTYMDKLDGLSLWREFVKNAENN